MEKKKVASIMRYKDSLTEAMEWLDRLPVPYPTYVLAGVEEKDWLIWTIEEGFFITKHKKKEDGEGKVERLG